jgi:hypothetical protein
MVDKQHSVTKQPNTNYWLLLGLFVYAKYNFVLHSVIQQHPTQLGLILIWSDAVVCATWRDTGRRENRVSCEQPFYELHIMGIVCSVTDYPGLPKTYLYIGTYVHAYMYAYMYAYIHAYIHRYIPM